jgi:hypothetical protein
MAEYQVNAHRLSRFRRAARKEAKEAEAGRFLNRAHTRAPLEPLPVSLEDMDADMPTTAGEGDVPIAGHADLLDGPTAGGDSEAHFDPSDGPTAGVNSDSAQVLMQQEDKEEMQANSSSEKVREVENEAMSPCRRPSTLPASTARRPKSRPLSAPFHAPR